MGRLGRSRAGNRFPPPEPHVRRLRVRAPPRAVGRDRGLALTCTVDIIPFHSFSRSPMRGTWSSSFFLGHPETQSPTGACPSLPAGKWPHWRPGSRGTSRWDQGQADGPSCAEHLPAPHVCRCQRGPFRSKHLEQSSQFPPNSSRPVAQDGSILGPPAPTALGRSPCRSLTPPYRTPPLSTCSMVPPCQQPLPLPGFSQGPPAGHSVCPLCPPATTSLLRQESVSCFR